MLHARDEYHFVYVHSLRDGSTSLKAHSLNYRYAVYVLEAATSNRLTFFLPPLVCTTSRTHAT